MSNDRIIWPDDAFMNQMDECRIQQIANGRMIIVADIVTGEIRFVHDAATSDKSQMRVVDEYGELICVADF